MLSVFATEAELGEQKPVPLHAVLPKDQERFLSSLGAIEASPHSQSDQGPRVPLIGT